jgi:tetratricopeptide (TPR) repeat protein
MTFDHGDYAAIDGIEHKDRLVEKLYRRSLAYSPNAEAYLGLAILNQKRGALQAAVALAAQGCAHFPNDARLNICLGVGLMNLAQYGQALERLLKFQDEKDALRFAARCYEAMGDRANAAIFMDKYHEMKDNDRND